MRRMAAQYQALRGTPGFEMFRNLGVLGHMASRAGRSSFARPQRRRERTNPVQADAVLPIDAADALDGRIQASLTELARQSRANTLRRNAEAQAEQDMVATTSAALALVTHVVWLSLMQSPDSLAQHLSSRLAHHQWLSSACRQIAFARTTFDLANPVGNISLHLSVRQWS